MKYSAFLVFLLLWTTPLFSSDTFVVTSGLRGGFNPSLSSAEDQLLITASRLAAEVDNGAVHLDLGGSMYPGPLSRYSYGAVMGELFRGVNTSACLLSSRDLRVGVDSLMFMQKNDSIPFLSANILQSGRQVFAPFRIMKRGDGSVALIGITSTGYSIDAAETEVYELSLEDLDAALTAVLSEEEVERATYRVVLTDLPSDVALRILSRHKKAHLVISAGDVSENMAGLPVRRIVLEDGRGMLRFPQGEGYFRVTVPDHANAESISVRRVLPDTPVVTPQWKEMSARIERWKKEYQKEMSVVVADVGTNTLEISPERMAHLLRHHTGAEIAVVPREAMKDISFTGEVRKGDILNAFYENYPIVVSTLNGDELQSLLIHTTSVHSGYRNGKVQGREVESTRPYRVAATQEWFDNARRQLGRTPEHRITWKTLADYAIADSAGEKVLQKDDYTYLSRRFRFTVDPYLRLHITRLAVDRDDDVDIPPGRSDDSYTRWGLESEVVFRAFNSLHFFELVPRIDYYRQDEEYLQNLLRGTFFYRLDVPFFARPYHKSQYDTLLVPVDNERPGILRQTIGIYMELGPLQGRTGGGFERTFRSEENILRYGMELIAGISLDLPWDFSWNADVDTFLGFSEDDAGDYLRSEMRTRLRYHLSEKIAFDLGYTWFQYNSLDRDAEYRNNMFNAGLSLQTEYTF